MQKKYDEFSFTHAKFMVQAEIQVHLFNKVIRSPLPLARDYKDEKDLTMRRQVEEHFRPRKWHVDSLQVGGVWHIPGLKEASDLR